MHWRDMFLEMFFKWEEFLTYMTLKILSSFMHRWNVFLEVFFQREAFFANLTKKIPSSFMHSCHMFLQVVAVDCVERTLRTLVRHVLKCHVVMLLFMVWIMPHVYHRIVLQNVRPLIHVQYMFKYDLQVFYPTACCCHCICKAHVTFVGWILYRVRGRLLAAWSWRTF